MKRTANCILMASAIVCCACNMDREAKNNYENTMSIVSSYEDKMLYATLDEVIGSDSIIAITDMGDTITLAMANEDTMLGEAIPGSRLAITRNASKKNIAQKIINMTQLIGEWVEPSPLAEGSYTGISLLEGGVAAAINSQTTEYEDWRLDADKLLLSSVAKGMDVNEALIDTFRINLLTADSLRLSGPESRFYFCRISSIKVSTESKSNYQRETDEADKYDLFNPEGTTPDDIGDENSGLMKDDI